jgi:hypothetical protein
VAYALKLILHAAEIIRVMVLHLEYIIAGADRRVSGCLHCLDLARQIHGYGLIMVSQELEKLEKTYDLLQQEL